MKCPKCGSEEILESGMPNMEDKRWCAHTDCGFEFSAKEQRLQNVLDKFNQDANPYFIIVSYSITLRYWVNSGRFELNEVEISIETVEHLIKDLEGNDEEK